MFVHERVLTKKQGFLSGLAGVFWCFCGIFKNLKKNGLKYLFLIIEYVVLIKIEPISGFLNRCLIFYIDLKGLKRPKIKKSKKSHPWRDPSFHIPFDVVWCADSKSHQINECFSTLKRVLGQKSNNVKNRFFNFQSETPLLTYCSTRLDLLILNLYRFFMICKETREILSKSC